MTAIVATINGHSVSTKFVELRISGDDMEVRNWECILTNIDNEWDGDFPSASVASFEIDGVVVLQGYVDDDEPYVHQRFYDVSMIKVIGRGNGFDLQSLTHSKKYSEEKIDEMCDDALSVTGSEITFTSPDAGTEVSYEFKDTYLGDGFKEKAKSVNYTFYTENSKAFHLFAVGDADEYLDGGGGRPDIDLILDDDDTNNNIIRLKKGNYGRPIFNSIKLNAGSLRDHWTDLNADDWTPDGNCIITDETSDNDFKGKGKIKFTKTVGAGALEGDLDFSGTLYEYSSLDLSERNFMIYMAYVNTLNPANLVRTLRPRLTDGSGNEIEYRRNTAFLNQTSRDNRTENITHSRWMRLSIPIGEGLTIDATAGGKSERWGYSNTVSTFDWSDVVKIGFTTGSVFPVNVADYFYIDDLEIATVDVISIAEDAGSIASYKKRVLPKNRFDVTSQVELDALSASLLELKKNPLTKVDCIIKGEPNIKYTGQSLDLYSPPYGLNDTTNPLKFRILSFEHVVALKSFTPVKAFQYSTKLTLIQDQVGGAQQLADMKMVDYSNSPIINFIVNFEQYMRDYELYERKNQERKMNWELLPNEMPEGASFPSDPEEGDYFKHTGWEKTFVWDDILSQWVVIDYIKNGTSGVTADVELTGVTADREQAGMTADRELTGLTADRETSGVTADRETSGVVTDNIGDRSIEDTEQSGTTNITLTGTPTWDTVWTSTTYTDHTEEVWVSVRAYPLDLPETGWRWIDVRVEVDGVEYPGAAGEIALQYLNKVPNTWHILVPIDVYGEFIRVKAKDSHGNEYDFLVFTDLIAPHNHGITEPNGGAGHDTGVTDGGHNTDLNEPNAGTGHDTGITDGGHATDLNEPNGGDGHGEGEGNDGHNTYETTDPP